MCSSTEEQQQTLPAGTPSPIPSDLPLYDAHCHPTDAPSSLSRIQVMRVAALVIMSTRAQDQGLVADAAAAAGRGKTIIPAFGWHPWFSHQLYDDDTTPGDNSDTFKAAHYKAVLVPEPTDEFVDSLPAPRRLSEYINEMRHRLRANPAAMVGEIGIDKAFRLPEAFASTPAPPPALEASDLDITPGGREGRRLSPYRVRVQHQVAVMAAQLRIAAELQRPVSIHSVQAHGVVFDALQAMWKGHEKEIVGRRKRRMAAAGAEEDYWPSDDSESKDGDASPKPKTKPYPPRICLHSFSGPAEVGRQYVHPAIPVSVFFSFSTVVNVDGPGASDDRLAEVLGAVPDNRILVESDWHQAGEEMDRVLAEMYMQVCRLKGWDIKEGGETIGRNFCDFVGGKSGEKGGTKDC